MFNIFKKTSKSRKWVIPKNNNYFGNVSKFIDENGKILFQVSDICYQTNPCQHKIKIGDSDSAKSELWFKGEIIEYLKKNNIPSPNWHFFTFNCIFL
jgi:hypothetical protein